MQRMTSRASATGPPWRRRVGVRPASESAATSRVPAIRSNLHHAAGEFFRVSRISAVGVRCPKCSGLAVHVVPGAAGRHSPQGSRTGARMNLVAFTLTFSPRRSDARPQPAFSARSCTAAVSAIFRPLAFHDVQSVRHTPAPPILNETSNGPAGVGDRYFGQLQVRVIADHLDNGFAWCSSLLVPSLNRGYCHRGRVWDSRIAQRVGRFAGPGRVWPGTPAEPG